MKYLVYHELTGFYKIDYLPDISPYRNRSDPLPIKENIYLRNLLGTWYISAIYKDRVHKPGLAILTNWRMIHNKNNLPNHLKIKALLLNIPL